MIDPPTQAPDTTERRIELKQTVDYAVQVILEEARSLGWTSDEFCRDECRRHASFCP